MKLDHATIDAIKNQVSIRHLEDQASEQFKIESLREMSTWTAYHEWVKIMDEYRRNKLFLEDFIIYLDGLVDEIEEQHDKED